VVSELAQKQTKTGRYTPKKKGRTMKAQISLKKNAAQPERFRPILATLLLLAATTCASLGQVLPPQSHAYGMTYAELLTKWWQWSLAFPVSADPEFGTADISANQSGPVWFLPKPLGGGTATIAGTVPAG
jgi:hypothetical protein